MRILGFGTYDTTKHPRVGIVLEGFRAGGDEVIEANAPLGISTADRVAMLGRPWLAHRLIRRVLARWWILIFQARRVRRTGPFDVVVVGYLGHFDVLLARVLFPQDLIVLDLLILAADTARDRGVSAGPKVKVLALLDRLAVRCADVVMVDTVEHRDLLPPSRRDKAVVVPVGAPAAWFVAGEARREENSPGPLRVVWFGLFTPLQGAGVIGEALAELADCPHVATTMIGVGQESALAHAAASGSKQVKWLDWVDSAALPILVAAHDVCLGIFGTTPKAQRVVPNKVYQGAAAGCAVVTSDTAPQRRALGEAAVFVPAGDSRALAEALRQLAVDPERVLELRDAALSRSREHFSPLSVVTPLRRKLASESSTRQTRGHPS